MKSLKVKFLSTVFALTMTASFASISVYAEEPANTEPSKNAPGIPQLKYQQLEQSINRSKQSINRSKQSINRANVFGVWEDSENGIIWFVQKNGIIKNIPLAPLSKTYHVRKGETLTAEIILPKSATITKEYLQKVEEAVYKSRAKFNAKANGHGSAQSCDGKQIRFKDTNAVSFIDTLDGNLYSFGTNANYNITLDGCTFVGSAFGGCVNCTIKPRDRKLICKFNEPGYYRFVLTGTAHVYAVVAYDIAEATYYLSSYTEMDNFTESVKNIYLDRSLVSDEFNDHQNSVIPFKVD